DRLPLAKDALARYIRPHPPARATPEDSMRWIAPVVLLATLAACETATSYDLVVANGRVIDPESGLDGVRHVGITGGKIAAISETPLRGTRAIDAAHNVAAP